MIRSIRPDRIDTNGSVGINGCVGPHSRRRVRRWGRLAGPLAAIALAVAASSTGQAPVRQRLVVLGFEGADDATVRRMLADGELPNLAALAAEGGAAPLRPTNPPQTAVSWSTFATGLNPGRTEITDSVTRLSQTYQPADAVVRSSRGPYRILGLTSPVFGLAFGTVAGLFAGAVLVLFRRLRRGRRRRQTLRHGAGALTALGVFVVGMIGGIAGSSFAERWLPRQAPAFTNHRSGETFWETAAAVGVRARIVRVPTTFPAREIPGGEVISGLGVPGINGSGGGNGPTVYTSDPALSEGVTATGVTVIRIAAPPEPVTTRIAGPRSLFTYDPAQRVALRERGAQEKIDLPLTIRTDAEAGSVALEAAGGETVKLRAGEWSDWVVLGFSSSAFAAVRGISRFHLYSVTPHLTLYLAPIQYHPDEAGLVGFAAPADAAARWAEEFGLFDTAGEAIDTRALRSGLLDVGHVLDDVTDTTAQFRRMLAGWLARDDWDLHVQVFDAPDLVAHAVSRLLDPEHPGQAAAAARRYADGLRRAYLTMDEIVGEARAAQRPGDRLIVLSDHGFEPRARSIHLNRWLAENGYLLIREAGADETPQELFFRIDWSRTRAYATGTGSIYLNVVGREPQGSVGMGDEYRQIRDEIADRLIDWVDPDSAAHPVAQVYEREQIWQLYDPLLAPDLRVATAPGYRVSDLEAHGAIGGEIVTVDAGVWSGGHASSPPERVPGIVFTSFGGLREDPWIGDLAPTILELLGVSAPADLDGSSLLGPSTPGASR